MIFIHFLYLLVLVIVDGKTKYIHLSSTTFIFNRWWLNQPIAGNEGSLKVKCHLCVFDKRFVRELFPVNALGSVFSGAFSLRAFLCLFVCAQRVCVVPVLYIFAWVFLHGCVSILTFPHSSGKWEAASQETHCRIHTVWKTRRKRAGLTLRCTWRLWRLRPYQPLLLWLTYSGKTNPTDQDMDKELSSLRTWWFQSQKGVWASLAVKDNHNHQEQIESKIKIFVLYNIRNNMWSSSCRTRRLLCFLLLV